MPDSRTALMPICNRIEKIRKLSFITTLCSTIRIDCTCQNTSTDTIGLLVDVNRKYVQPKWRHCDCFAQHTSSISDYERVFWQYHDCVNSRLWPSYPFAAPGVHHPIFVCGARISVCFVFWPLYGWSFWLPLLITHLVSASFPYL